MKTIIEPFRIKSVEPLHHSTLEERERLLADGRLQPLPDPGQRHPHRPAHRFRHQRDVHRAVGGHDARRRVLCRQRELLPAQGRGRGPHRFPPRHSHAPGARRRAHPVRRHVPRRPHRPQQHALRYHARQHRIERRHRARPALSEAADTQALLPFKGNLDVAALERVIEAEAPRASRWSC